MCRFDMSVLPEGAVCPECGHARGLHPSVSGDYVSDCAACLLGGYAREAVEARDEVLGALAEFRVALLGWYRVSKSK